MNPWITYRTRFLVKAKQLTSNLSFIDDLGRQHSGTKGDYLVEWSDGVLRIAPRKVFEDIYVPMASQDESSAMPETSTFNWSFLRKPVSSNRSHHSPIPLDFARKSPQTCRTRQAETLGMTSLQQL